MYGLLYALNHATVLSVCALTLTFACGVVGPVWMIFRKEETVREALLMAFSMTCFYAFGMAYLFGWKPGMSIAALASGVYILRYVPHFTRRLREGLIEMESRKKMFGSYKRPK